MKRIYYLFLIACSSVIISCSTLNVSHVEVANAKQKSEGIYYSFPKTVITVDVTVEKTDKLKGPYSSFASKYLGLTDVITENSTSYSLISASLDSYNIPDAQQYYFVDCNKMNKKRLLLQFSEAGFITGVNNKMGEYPDKKKPDSDVVFTNDNPVILNQNIFSPDIAEKFDTIIEKIQLDSNIIIKKTIKKSYVEKTDEQKAKEAADFIMKLEESRLSLLTGYSEVNYSKEAIQYMADQLMQIEEEYLHLFTGITVKHQQKYYYSYIPGNEKVVENIPLLRFSEKYGVCDTSDYKGDNVYLTVKKSESTLDVASFEQARLNPKEKYHGFYYRVPEYGSVYLEYNQTQKVNSNILISQFGAVCELPAKEVRSVSFYPESGSIEKIAISKRKHFFWGHHR